MQLHLVIAHNEQQIADAERLRFRVYCEEERLLPTPQGSDARERDSYDFDETACHLLAYAGHEPVGTIRLIAPRSSSGEASRRPRFAFESKFRLSGFDRHEVVLGEVSRYCVLRRFRGTRVTPALYATLREESQRRGVTHWVAAANMETDSAEDAAIAFKLIQTKNLLSRAFCAEPRHIERALLGPKRFVYSEEERASARRGELEALKLPRILGLFTTKMGARVIGAPAYDAQFNVFAAPVAVSLRDLGDPRAGSAVLADSTRDSDCGPA